MIAFDQTSPAGEIGAGRLRDHGRLGVQATSRLDDPATRLLMEPKSGKVLLHGVNNKEDLPIYKRVIGYVRN